MSKRNYSKKTWYKDLKNNLDTNEINCIYCGERLIKETFTVDHIDLHSEGGEFDENNCKPCCRFCNQLRGDMEYNKFIVQYPKEKLLRLKKYTNSSTNLELAGIEYMENLKDKLENIQNNLAEILENKKELTEMVSVYSKLDNQVSKEITYSSNLNASQGYKLYAKKRETGRQLEKYQNQLSTVDKISRDLSIALSLVGNKKNAIKEKLNNDKYAKKVPISKDIENIIDNKVKNNTLKNTKYKTYKFSRSSSLAHQKNQYKQLCRIWQNVEIDEINKIYKCSGKVK